MPASKTSHEFGISVEKQRLPRDTPSRRLVPQVDSRVVRSVFVEPRCQGRGVGRRLMVRIGRAAVSNGGAVLAVPSSVTAEPFQGKLGVWSVRGSHHGEERTIVMERTRLRPIGEPGRDP